MPGCPQCGSPFDPLRPCPVCDHSEQKVLELVREDGHALRRISVTTSLNRRWARGSLGEDGRFWESSWQFRLERTDEEWHLVPNPAATNETLVDRSAVTATVVLTDGVEIAVGRAATGVFKTPLIVKLV